MELNEKEKERFNQILPALSELFKNSGTKVFTVEALRTFINDNRKSMELRKKISTAKIIDILVQNTKLSKIELRFPNNNYTRYSWSDYSPYSVALSIVEGGFLSHYSALYLHQLTEQIPKTIYVNVGQRKAQIDDRHKLTQEKIDKAFSKSRNLSNETAVLNEYNITIIHTATIKGLGIATTMISTGELIAVTDIAKTLIDAVVRPEYCGGVYEVLKAFQLAAGSFSTNVLLSYVDQLNYAYPYHQLIGFYMERSGAYKAEILKVLEVIPKQFDFYLMGGMVEKEYSTKWRVYFPKGM